MCDAAAECQIAGDAVADVDNGRAVADDRHRAAAGAGCLSAGPGGDLVVYAASAGWQRSYIRLEQASMAVQSGSGGEGRGGVARSGRPPSLARFERRLAPSARLVALACPAALRSWTTTHCACRRSHVGIGKDL